MQGAIRSTSSSTFQASSTGTGTVNRFSSFMRAASPQVGADGEQGGQVVRGVDVVGPSRCRRRAPRRRARGGPAARRGRRRRRCAAAPRSAQVDRSSSTGLRAAPPYVATAAAAPAAKRRAQPLDRRGADAAAGRRARRRRPDLGAVRERGEPGAQRRAHPGRPVVGDDDLGRRRTAARDLLGGRAERRRPPARSRPRRAAATPRSTSGSPSSATSALGPPIRAAGARGEQQPGDAVTSPGSRAPGGTVPRAAPVDVALGLAPAAGREPPQRSLHDLGGDRHRGLLGGARAEVEPDRRVQPGELVLGQPRPRAAGAAGRRGCAGCPSRRRRRPASAARPRAAARRTSGRGSARTSPCGRRPRRPRSPGR